MSAAASTRTIAQNASVEVIAARSIVMLVTQADWALHLCYRNRTARSASLEFCMPPIARTAPNRWLVLAIVCLAQFMVVLDATIVNIALPSIQRGLSFSDANLQWVINSYTLVLGGFLLLGGRAADLLGRKRLFLAGVEEALAPEQVSS